MVERDALSKLSSSIKMLNCLFSPRELWNNMLMWKTSLLWITYETQFLSSGVLKPVTYNGKVFERWALLGEWLCKIFIWSKSSFVVYSVLWFKLFFFWLIQDLKHFPLNVKLELDVNQLHTQRRRDKKNKERLLTLRLDIVQVRLSYLWLTSARPVSASWSWTENCL